MRKGGFRSSRLYYPITLNPVMNKNTMYYKVVKGKPVEVEEGKEYNYVVTARASSYDGEEWPPFKAFRQVTDSFGWRSTEGNIVGEWIEISLPLWYKRPENQNPTVSGSYPPAVTSLEIWTTQFLNSIPKKFKILGSYDGIVWNDIRECEIKKQEGSKRLIFPFFYKNGDEEIPFDQFPTYRYFRLEITEGFDDEEYAGFAQINFCAHMDHNNPYFPQGWYPVHIQNTGITEKMFIQNDDNDGIIWEKVHKIPNIIFSTVSWYPGFYASTSYHTTMFRMRDPIRPYIGKTHSAYNKNTVQRTKDFIMSIDGSYYYSSRALISISNDGVHWTKDYTEPNAYTWMSSGYSWSTKRNVGIMSGYRVEIDDNGKFKAIKIPSASGAAVGDVMANGATGDVYSSVRQYYKFINADGDEYVSPLQANYSYHDDGRPEGQKSVWGPTNWNFVYLNGKYYAYGKFNDWRYWNEIRKEWQTLQHFTIVESSDGFKTITAHSIADPVIGNSFRDVCLYYFNEHLLLFEKGQIRDPETDQWVEHSRVYDYGKSFGNTPIVRDTLDYITVPLIGYNADSAYDSVALVFKGRGPASERIKKLDIGFTYNTFGHTVYIKDNKPSEPYDHLVFRTAFKKNYWSSNSYDEGGFVFLHCDSKQHKIPFTVKGDQNSLAYGTSNALIDRDDGTWGPRGK